MAGIAKLVPGDTAQGQIIWNQDCLLESFPTEHDVGMAGPWNYTTCSLLYWSHFSSPLWKKLWGHWRGWLAWDCCVFMKSVECQLLLERLCPKPSVGQKCTILQRTSRSSLPCAMLSLPPAGNAILPLPLSPSQSPANSCSLPEHGVKTQDKDQPSMQTMISIWAKYLHMPRTG